MSKKDKCLYPDFRMLEFRAENVLYILQLLEKHSLFVVLDGGWGVDALMNKQSRIHSDLDILILEKELGDVVSVLEKEGFSCIEEETELPNRYVMYCEITQRLIDIHPLKELLDGGYLLDMINFVFVYPRESVMEYGRINDQRVRCITAEQQRRCRLNKQYDRNDPDRLRRDNLNADEHDLNLLQEK